jgi:16S rRNA (uracil1498-N3)-methyltransferase
MHRFFVWKEDIKNYQAVIKGEEFRHLSKVLRLMAGDAVTIFDGKGREYQGNISTMGKDEAVVEVGEPLFSPRESPLEVWLVQGIPKGEKMEMIIQKATELGVRGVIPLKTQRSVVKLEGKKEEARRERWQKVAVEAAKQCRRALVPEVLSPCSITNFLTGLPLERHLFVPWEEGGVSIKEVLTVNPSFPVTGSASGSISEAKIEPKSKFSPAPVPVYLVIGPEGGLAAEEVDQMKKYGGIPLTLGSRILRTETAGLAALAVVMFAWGDLG